VKSTISADVATLFALWLRDDTNYGFFVRNSDENPNTLTVKTCLTTHATNAVLEFRYDEPEHRQLRSLFR
jgi:hypothetical protein